MYVMTRLVNALFQPVTHLMTQTIKRVTGYSTLLFNSPNCFTLQKALEPDIHN